MGLFRPRWQNANLQKAAKAVENISDQKLLAEITLGDATHRVRRATIERLTDEDTLTLFAHSTDTKKYSYDYGFGYRFNLCETARKRLEELRGV